MEDNNKELLKKALSKYYSSPGRQIGSLSGLFFGTIPHLNLETDEKLKSPYFSDDEKKELEKFKIYLNKRKGSIDKNINQSIDTIDTIVDRIFSTSIPPAHAESQAPSNVQKIPKTVKRQSAPLPQPLRVQSPRQQPTPRPQSPIVKSNQTSTSQKRARDATINCDDAKFTNFEKNIELKINSDELKKNIIDFLKNSKDISRIRFIIDKYNFNTKSVEEFIFTAELLLNIKYIENFLNDKSNHIIISRNFDAFKCYIDEIFLTPYINYSNDFNSGRINNVKRDAGDINIENKENGKYELKTVQNPQASRYKSFEDILNTDKITNINELSLFISSFYNEKNAIEYNKLISYPDRSRNNYTIFEYTLLKLNNSEPYFNNIPENIIIRDNLGTFYNKIKDGEYNKYLNNGRTKVTHRTEVNIHINIDKLSISQVPFCYLCGFPIAYNNDTKKFHKAAYDHVIPVIPAYISGIIQCPLNFVAVHSFCNGKKTNAFPIIKEIEEQGLEEINKGLETEDNEEIPNEIESEIPLEPLPKTEKKNVLRSIFGSVRSFFGGHSKKHRILGGKLNLEDDNRDIYNAFKDFLEKVEKSPKKQKEEFKINDILPNVLKKELNLNYLKTNNLFWELDDRIQFLIERFLLLDEYSKIVNATEQRKRSALNVSNTIKTLKLK